MWLCYAKNLLLIIWTATFLSITPAIALIIRGDTWRGLLILFIAVFSGAISFSLADYWHKRNVHATPFGFIIALLLFIAGSIWLWFHYFYFWIPIALLVLFIIYGYLTGKNK